MNEQDDISIVDNEEAVTIKITGAAYENLRRVAEVMNRVEWTDNDHSPVWAVRHWMYDFTCLSEMPTDTNYGGSIAELCENIIYAIDTGFDEGTEEDKARREELENAFKRAKLYV